MDDVLSSVKTADGRSAAKGWLRALELTKPIERCPRRVLPVIVHELAEAHGDAPALLSERECFSFSDLARRMNRYARWALGQGIGAGDVVCLLMPNRPEYMAIWLGITRVGGVVALINTNLVGTSLAHSINIAAPRHIIVAEELAEAFAAAQPHIVADAKVWRHGAGAAGDTAIERAVDALPGHALVDAECLPPAVTDRALLIYTSGTTGLPKAARISHYRVLIWSLWFAGLMDTRPGDRMYDCLPMYHSVGGVVATGAVLVNGGSVVIRDKFSARRFWDDVVRWDCTLVQYIGELCRYLVHAPPHPLERAHRIRLACGNGLRGDVWTDFKERFQLPRIIEFYASTEGNVTLFNYEGRPGAIGRIPPFLAHRSSVALVRFDVDTGTLLRDDRGRCIRCRPGEMGEAIGSVSDGPANPGRFEGYTDRQATEDKLLRDVFVPGDVWFRTGDLMRKDEKGYFYFVDRIGDTFRWKGENASTSEVAAVIQRFAGVADVSVYGVAVPGHDGRAGMAALTGIAPAQLGKLRDHLVEHLSAPARPLFLRLCARIETTATFKHQKDELVRQGFDPAATDDPIYFHDPVRRAFVLLDRATHQQMLSGAIRL
jgi:fatty-acyl-CoA synthase